MPTFRAAATLALTSLAAAQPPAQPAQPAAQPPQIPPALRLGLRADQVRTRLPVLPTLVIVKDATSFVDAIAEWRVNQRFPILWDDGTPTAREHIARFARAFKPKKTLRWSSSRRTMSEWGADTALVENAVGRAWTLDGTQPLEGFDRAGVLKLWKELQLTPPGIAVAAKDDPAWPAALALAAGRGMPIFWTTSSRRLDAPMSVADADILARSIEQFAESSGFSWKSLGDDLDAIALCASIPQTITGTRTGIIATTDRLGRTADNRWAYAAQNPGLPPAAVYRAMCALFLPTNRQAWIFDSYPDEPGWNEYSGVVAEKLLAELKWSVASVQKPAGTIDAWRRATKDPLAADLILVNTKGEKNQFHLASGTGALRDLPMLSTPPVVYFVHSFSAQFVGTRETLAGRWLDRGAAAYIGSVDEPQLSGFMPTPAVAARFSAQVPLAAAPRFDNAPAHKITIIGDPLLTFGNPAPAPATDTRAPSLPNAVDLADEVRTLVRADLAEGIWTLVILGRDDDAAKLAAALAKTGPAQWNPAAALAGASALYRTGKLDDLKELFKRLSKDDLAKHPDLQDMNR
jgi:hypothetical protein